MEKRKKTWSRNFVISWWRSEKRNLVGQ